MKRAAFVTVPVVLISLIAGWQLHDIASAASASKHVCLSGSGKVSKKSKCSSTDTEIAAGKVRSKSIAKKAIKNGTTRLSPSAAAQAAGVSEFATSTEQPLVSTLGSTVRAYTYALTFPSAWDGSISTACASNEVQAGAYSAAYLGGTRLPSTSSSNWFFTLGYVGFNSGGTTEFMRIRVQTSSDGNATISDTNTPPAPGFSAVAIDANLTIYVVQLCVPLTTLEGVG